MVPSPRKSAQAPRRAVAVRRHSDAGGRAHMRRRQRERDERVTARGCAERFRPEQRPLKSRRARRAMASTTASRSTTAAARGDERVRACLGAAEVHLDPPHDKTLLIQDREPRGRRARRAPRPPAPRPRPAAAGGGGRDDDPFDDPFADLGARGPDPRDRSMRTVPAGAAPTAARRGGGAAIDPFAAMRDVPPPPPPPAPAPAAAAPPCRRTDNPWDGVDVQELETAAVDEAKRAEEAAVDHCTRANPVDSAIS